MSHYHPQLYYPYYGGYYAYPYTHWPYATSAYYPTFCSQCGHPAHHCQCAKPLAHMKLPLELLADTANPSQQTFVGGLEAVSLSLEYMKTGTSPSLKVSITETGITSVADITPIDDGYHIKESFLTVAPGATLKLDVTDCTARLRWCELICC